MLGIEPVMQRENSGTEFSIRSYVEFLFLLIVRRYTRLVFHIPLITSAPSDPRSPFPSNSRAVVSAAADCSWR